MDIESLRDYLIADEIQRIQTLSQEDLMRELIALKSEAIERLDESELIEKCKSNHE